MKVYAAQITDEPGNAPILLLATSKKNLLKIIKKQLSWLDGIDDCTDTGEISSLYSAYCVEHGDEYGNLFTYEQVL